MKLAMILLGLANLFRVSAGRGDQSMSAPQETSQICYKPASGDFVKSVSTFEADGDPDPWRNGYPMEDAVRVPVIYRDGGSRETDSVSPEGFTY